MSLNGKVVIVTGSTTGIGEAIARSCIEQGARVVVHGRDKERGKGLVAEFNASSPGQAVLHIDDMADPEAPDRIVNTALEAFGQIDAVVNNAATMARNTLDDTTPEFFDHIFAVNLRAPMLLIKAAVDHLEKTRGCVLNIGSMNAYCGEDILLAYSMSKGGMVTMSRNLGNVLHVRRGIRVNHLNVGWVLTEEEKKRKREDGMSPGWEERLSSGTAPIGRIMRAEEIARIASRWISDETYPISGSIIDLEQFPMVGRVPPQETKQ
jgi:NAD(P)-dependent dehydrogenase (short-subunit alcohol dehydrogenase family)